MKTGLVFIAMAVASEAFVAPSSFSGSSLARAPTSSTSSSLQMAEKNAALETMDELERSVAPPGGGFWFGSAGFWGEEDYRGFVDGYKSDNLLNGVYPILDRVRETKILTTTAESGLLSELEDAGLTLSEAEKLLPALEESGVLSFAANNLDVLINLFGFIAIEPAKIAIPAVVSVVKALKGAGLLKLGNGDAPVASKPVKATKAPKAMKVAAAKVKAAAPSKAQVKAELKGASKAANKAAAKVKAAAPSKAQVKAEVKGASKAASKAAAKVKAAAPSKAQVKAELKGASKAANKAAAKVKAAAPSKAQVKAEVKGASKAASKAISKAVPKSAPSPAKGNISNLPKAL